MTGDVGSIMTRTVVTAGPNTSVPQIARLLIDHDISAVPVCDGEGRLLGIVSEGDLLRPFGSRNASRREWWLTHFAEGTDLAPDFLDYLRYDRHTAKDVMTATVHTVREDTPLTEAADLLSRHGVKRLPVLREGRLVGIVSRTDLLRSFLGGPPGAGAPGESAMAGP